MADAGEGAGLQAGSRVSCDVLIVGYGPVGMLCAGLFAQRGLEVVVVERHAQRYSLSRAGHLDGETMRTLQRLGVAETVELVAQPMLDWELVTAERELLSRITMGDDGSGWKADYLSYQPELEAIFDARARQLGVEVHMGVTAVAISPQADSVETAVQPTHQPGATSVIESAYLIGADGARSFVRDAIRVKSEDLGFPPLSQLVIDFEHSNPDRDLPQLQEVYQVLDVRRPSLAGRWNGRRWSRWEFALLEGEEPEWLASEETCWSLLGEWGIGPDHGRIDRRAVYTFESRLAETWRVGRVLLMGDAAHTMPPFMGQGMLSGVRDAANLAWKLPAVLRGDAGTDLLDSYECERSPHVRNVIEMSMAVGQIALMTNPEQARLRDEQLRSGPPPRPPLFPRLITGIVREPDAPGAIEAASADGRPSYQARVARDGRVARLDDHFAAPSWRIIARHPVPDDLFDERQRRLLAALDMQIVHVSRAATAAYIDIDGEFDLWFRRTGRKAFIERPDTYVFGTVETTEQLPDLLDQLHDSLVMHGWHGLDPAGPGFTAPAIGSDRAQRPGPSTSRTQDAGSTTPYPRPRASHGVSISIPDPPG